MGINSVLWGLPTASVISALGLYFTFRSRFFQITGIPQIVSHIKHDIKSDGKGGISSLGAICTSIGGSVGIGSITGVSIAIKTGGAGSIFWMLFAGFVSMMIKYAETNIAVRYRIRKENGFAGGAMYILKSYGKIKSAFLFSVFVLIAGIATGTVTQVAASADAAEHINLGRGSVGAAFAIMLFLVARKGKSAVSVFSSVMVPISGILYITAVSVIIIKSPNPFLYAFEQIFRSAFGVREIGAGVAGYGIAQAIRAGFTRGIYSTEAGMGSSAMAHAANETAYPHGQGMWAIFEVFTDTFVFSLLTAVSLIISDSDSVSEMFGKFFGYPGEILITVLLFMFGLSASLGWYFYAECALEFISGSQIPRKIYLIIQTISALFGAFAVGSLPWDAADIADFSMLAVNIYILFTRRKEILLCLKQSADSKSKKRKGD